MVAVKRTMILGPIGTKGPLSFLACILSNLISIRFQKHDRVIFTILEEVYKLVLIEQSKLGDCIL